MKTHNIRFPLLAIPLALALAGCAQDPDKKPADTKSQANNQAFNVEIDVAFVTFDLKEIEDMARQSSTAAPTQEQILKAWTAGKGKLLASSKTMTISGQQAKTEGIVEKIYPTEYEPPRVSDKHVPTTKNDWVSQPTPAGFQTRNIGLTVNATPQISPDAKTISLTMIPEFTELTRWSSIEAGEDEGRKTSKMWVLQPDFYVRRATTSITVPVNSTVITGGMPDSTGKLVTYIFVTAHKAPVVR